MLGMLKLKKLLMKTFKTLKTKALISIQKLRYEKLGLFYTIVGHVIIV